MVEHDRDVYRISGRDTVDVHQEPQGPIRVGYVDLVEDLVDVPGRAVLAPESGHGIGDRILRPAFQGGLDGSADPLALLGGA